MRVLTIGRNEDCDIIVEDPQNMISKKHAILRFYPLGKIEIVPLGRNFTYINGRLVQNEKAHKVTRKDVISFAHVKDLNWSLVPNPYAKIRNIIISILLAVILLFAGLLFFLNLKSCSSNNNNVDIVPTETGFGGVGSSPIETNDTMSNSKEEVVPMKVFPSENTKKKKQSSKKDSAKDNRKQKESDNKDIQIY